MIAQIVQVITEGAAQTGSPSHRWQSLGTTACMIACWLVWFGFVYWRATKANRQ
jgi:hypothetical protein